MDFKKLIADSINLKIEGTNLQDLITLVQEQGRGDYCIPCFSLAKVMRKSPVAIAEQIRDSITDQNLYEKIEVVNGYCNFYLNKNFVIKNVVSQALSQNDFYCDKQFEGQTLCIDYSSVNLAKYMHIGHLSTTIIGESIARMHEAKGYNVVRINYIGDYGTPFGKMIYAYLQWGSEAELNQRGVDYLQELYVKFCKCAEDDPALEEHARNYFKLIEQKDEKIYPIYQKFIEISKLEAKTLLDLLGVKFDSWKGESAYTQHLDGVVQMLQNKNLLTKSNGALIVDLEQYDKGCCLIQKSDGTSLYATRDIAAAIDRHKQYGFDKMYYVTAVQQKLHFEQFFKVLELLGYDFAKSLQHIYYGMFSLPTGKIASRRGKQAVLRDLMEYAYNKVLGIVENRQFTTESKQSVANKIAMSALKFNALKNERIKDSVFDVENCFSFDGDTSAYMQYTYARICSILRKANTLNAASADQAAGTGKTAADKLPNIDFQYLQGDATYDLIFSINQYKDTLSGAFKQNEPSILSKYALNLCKLFNKFYMAQKVITDNAHETFAKAHLLLTVKNTLGHLFHLLCIDAIEEM